MIQNLLFALNSPTIGWYAYIIATPIIKQWFKFHVKTHFIVLPMRYQHNNLIFSPKFIILFLYWTSIFLVVDIQEKMHILDFPNESIHSENKFR